MYPGPSLTEMNVPDCPEGVLGYRPQTWELSEKITFSWSHNKRHQTKMGKKHGKGGGLREGPGNRGLGDAKYYMKMV